MCLGLKCQGFGTGLIGLSDFTPSATGLSWLTHTGLCICGYSLSLMMFGQRTLILNWRCVDKPRDARAGLSAIARFSCVEMPMTGRDVWRLCRSQGLVISIHRGDHFLWLTSSDTICHNNPIQGVRVQQNIIVIHFDCCWLVRVCFVDYLQQILNFSAVNWFVINCIFGCR